MMDKKAIMRTLKELKYSLEYYERDYEIYGRGRSAEAIEYLRKEIEKYESMMNEDE